MTDPLDTELAALADAARQNEARHDLLPGLRWPDGVRMAVNLTCDFDAMLFRRLMNEPPMQLAKGEFGGRVGIWRLIELFDSHGVKATIFTPGRICELYPQSLHAAVRSGHELADHMWEHQVPEDPALERDHLRRSTEALTRIRGSQPVGTRSWHTHAALAGEGYIYNSHHAASHLPYIERDADGAHPLVNLPFHYAIDDAMFYNFAWLGSDNAGQRITDTDRVEAMWWEAFRQQYRRGGYLNICMHPFVSGRAQRIDMMDRLIARMKRMPGVWFATCEQVARHTLAARGN
jgi:peptidoglycan/xylan/chitin deacetylase (PgdA/CDA1 family)